MESSKEYQLIKSFIHEHYLDVLKISPIESLTPFEVGNILNDDIEFIFVAKLSPALYEPLKSPMYRNQVPIKMGMYTENTSLIMQFVLYDLTLESEITSDKITKFLSILKNQDKITLVVLDGYTYDVVWATNNISFKESKNAFKPIFDYFHIT